MNRVREFRKLQQLTQIELAKQIGIARQTLNMIENNKYNPTLALCISLAKALQTDLNTLFWEGENDETSNL
ncbi:helix-turn-helix transcriptional regulator [Solibacillus sp. MA9]|uniref:Helix-turn-helix transcriptional regulator n=1 Tax=Solibacillus palustris TaxID=2908203 RepID=A0ABS9UC26_9BACL|nr:helix-turn-helix transcriptional regulator [Solibacillus sp. MA9]MCH7321903.1 helix-turn-helix transcriptional regulator [Solibacillus sp. MA9]